MLTKSVRVEIEVPEGVSAEAKESAGRHAHEAAVLDLWQRGEFTIREAAAALELTYYDFLDLLAARGIPVIGEGAENGDFEEARRQLAEGRT